MTAINTKRASRSKRQSSIMPSQSISRPERERVSLNNYNLYCAISIAAMLDIRLREVIYHLRQEAQLQGDMPETNARYLSDITAGQVFSFLSLIGCSVKLPLAPGDIAAMATRIAINCKHYQEGTEELQQTTMANEELTAPGSPYDQPTSVIYMVAHAWMAGEKFDTGRAGSPYESATHWKQGLYPLAIMVLEDLGFGEFTDSGLDERIAWAMDLVIMNNTSNWAANYSWTQHWEKRLPKVYEYFS